MTEKAKAKLESKLMKTYDANNASINLDGQQLFGFGNDDYFNIDNQLADEIENKEPFEYKFELKKSLPKRVIKVDAPIEMTFSKNSWIKGHIRKIKGNKVTCSVNASPDIAERLLLGEHIKFEI